MAGIGKAYAQQIVNHFGVDTLQVISAESARLLEVPGIGKQRARAVKEAWESQQSVRDVMVFLQTYGVTVAQCLRIVRKFGKAAKTTLQREPYLLAREIAGIGFKTADRIAINLGFANDSPERLEAGILYTVQTLGDEGHTAFPTRELERVAAERLEANIDKVSLHLQDLLDAKVLNSTREGTGVQLPENARAETRIAVAVDRMGSGASHLPPIKVDIAIEWAQRKAGFAFAREQANAVRMALTEPLSIITGGPGTGKTTILRAVVDIVRAKKLKVLLASPTGRAAQRMADATGMPAQTIHRLLRFDPAKGRFTINESNPLKASIVIVDEASMLDTRLAAALFRTVPAGTHFVLVGDEDQLPSVGPGSVLHDLMAVDRIKVTRLRQIYRQEAQSQIVHTAHRILRGDPAAAFLPQGDSHPEEAGAEQLQFVRAETPEACVRAIVEFCSAVVKRTVRPNSIMDLQVLAPMHRGIAGIANLNQELQRTLNPSQGEMQITMGSIQYRVGDKILQTRNNYEKNIFNGDLGRVTEVHSSPGTLAAEFDGVPIDFDRMELGDLQLAYATSVHKAQGSEYPIVVIALLKQHYMMLQRNLIYTAVTRGRSQVVIVGDPVAYAMAVRNREYAARCTDLKNKLRNFKNDKGQGTR